METPFIYGKIVSEQHFINRDKELEFLIANFRSCINTTIISPRRWGKSSLVYKAAEKAESEDKNLRFIFLDLFNIRSEQEFYSSLASGILKASSDKMDGILELVRKFFKKIIPRISFSPDEQLEISFSFDWEQAKRDPEEILNLAERIAEEKNIRMIICIDEFQNISEFEDPLALQKKLRSNWQKHKKTGYCLYGSKRHMMMEVFTSSSMPFYKFGELMFLEKIKAEHWVPFIAKQFAQSGKKIDKELAVRITELCELHPYYIQQLSQQSWLRTKTRCWEETVADAFESLTLQLSLLFQAQTDDLTTTQINFLHALLNNEKHLSSMEVLTRYRLGTSANVSRIREALVEKEIIDIHDNRIEFLDPVYKNWLKEFYFVNQ